MPSRPDRRDVSSDLGHEVICFASTCSYRDRYSCNYAGSTCPSVKALADKLFCTLKESQKKEKERFETGSKKKGAARRRARKKVLLKDIVIPKGTVFNEAPEQGVLLWV